RPIRIRDDPVSNIIDLLAPGVGDLALKGRIYLLDDPGTDSFLPAITPTARVKFPTADASEGLGTGEYDFGLGLELDKQVKNFFLFADFGYTFIGNPPGANLRDQIAAGTGIGYQSFKASRRVSHMPGADRWSAVPTTQWISSPTSAGASPGPSPGPPLRPLASPMVALTSASGLQYRSGLAGSRAFRHFQPSPYACVSFLFSRLFLRQSTAYLLPCYH
ncbi:MAG: hypothetical protein ACE10C_13190, partial [Candidatus Binatia bacterium]